MVRNSPKPCHSGRLYHSYGGTASNQSARRRKRFSPAGGQTLRSCSPNGGWGILSAPRTAYPARHKRNHSSSLAELYRLRGGSPCPRLAEQRVKQTVEETVSRECRALHSITSLHHTQKTDQHRPIHGFVYWPYFPPYKKSPPEHPGGLSIKHTF